jgi:hypothetical protein
MLALDAVAAGAPPLAIVLCDNILDNGVWSGAALRESPSARHLQAAWLADGVRSGRHPSIASPADERCRPAGLAR